ncbi:hypothetical protein WICPIJ_004003 [Wickerhamomyces pijperi]|uniref:Uncharacterized protein n=1 Tax=Wickerhamomyces pijperi TaxID=599730 RepID=A0A9P8TMG7_WICPI|nr:hypothetical protein WICPIJ_004003 [Wickerhamomyces pijperi]
MESGKTSIKKTTHTKLFDPKDRHSETDNGHDYDTHEKRNLTITDTTQNLTTNNTVHNTPTQNTNTTNEADKFDEPPAK